jgi:hypothetical protein
MKCNWYVIPFNPVDYQLYLSELIHHSEQNQPFKLSRQCVNNVTLLCNCVMLTGYIGTNFAL